MKNKFFIVLGLAAIFGLTACVEQQVINPNFNPVENTINTQFYFNISAAAGQNPDTKQADTNVQANANFRGINNATLFVIIDSTMTPENCDFPARKMVVPVEAAASRDLSAILDKGAINAGATGGTRIVEINLPVGTNKLVFYAKATRAPIDGLDERELYGAINYTAPDPNGITMDLANLIGSYEERRLSKTDSAASDLIQKIIVQSFNGILRTGHHPTATGWYDTTLTSENRIIKFDNGETVSSYEVSVMHWADYIVAADDDDPRSPYIQETVWVGPGATDSITRPAPAGELEKILGKAYDAIANASAAAEIRGGSGSSSARILSDLYNTVAAGANATPVSLGEAVAQIIFKKLTSNIEKLTVPAVVTITGEREWRTPSVVKDIVGLESYSIASKYSINDYPDQMHLPKGAVTIGLDSIAQVPSGNNQTGKASILQVKYVFALDTLLNGSTSSGNLYSYRYPTELCYYGNSSIRVNNSNDVSLSSYPSYQSWMNSSSWSTGGWLADGNKITNATRGVALTNTIQYGVSMLASRLRVSSTDLTDNGANLADQTKTLSLNNTHYLDWTGILIGGQPEQVGWDYLLKKSNGVPAGSNAIVYDKVNYRMGYEQDTCGIRVDAAGLLGASSSTSDDDAFTNYTLLYDNVDPYTSYTGEGDEVQNPVYVALEFENHLGQDFWGEQGLIRDGATFYLLAKLTPNPNSSADGFWNSVWTDYCNNNLLPPYNNDGTTRHIRRVFVQDIKTGVTFQLTSTSLAHAYVSIPDLRSAKISLGLSVDLTWTPGLTYEVPLGQR